MGQLTHLADDGQELVVYTYNPDGTPRAVTNGPIRQEYAYDLDKNLTGLTVRSGDPLLSQTSYADDGNEVVRLIRPNEYDGDGFQFTYDAQGRVLTVLSPNVSIAGMICTSCS